MEYPTLQGKLLMPEYGRNVQHMVEHALTIADRDERSRCVEAILKTMTNLHPELKNEQQQHVYYDHLALMSNFQLDIDYPYGMPQPEELKLLPEHLQYSNPAFPFRHYGRVIQAIIREACKETDEDRKHDLINKIANRLKYTYLLWNKDQVDEGQIVNDIERMSKGLLSCNFEGFQLLHSWQLVGKESEKTNTGKKKKKK